MDRVILHLDMNAFFASVEQRENPALRGKPVVVVGGLGRRGIILTASYEARPYGIKTGMLLHQAQALCPTLVPVAGDFRKYVEASKSLFPLLERFTEKVEMTSCDEAFMDITEARRAPDWDRALQTAAAVQRLVGEELSLPCSIGVAPNKLLAKLASDMKKPRGLTRILPTEVEGLLAPLPVESLCGIGPRMKKNLEVLGVRTCGQLAAMDFETLYTRFGAWGHWLKRMGRGQDDAPVARVDAVDTVKSVGHATTFPANTRDPDVLKAYVMFLSEKVAARARRYRLAGREVVLTVRDADFKTRTHHRALGEAIFTDDAIFAAAVGLLTEKERLEKPVRLVSMCLARLEPDGGQPSLFKESERPRKLAETLDRLNARYGKGTVGRARSALAKKHGVLSPPVPPALRAADD